jgi:hypothetical protein
MKVQPGGKSRGPQDTGSPDSRAHVKGNVRAHLLLLSLAALQHGLRLRVVHHVAVREEPLQEAYSCHCCQPPSHWGTA